MKNKVFLFFALSILGIGIGYWFAHSYDFGLCKADFVANTFDVSCHKTFNKIGNALFYSMQAIAAVFLALLFVPQAYKPWKKFAVWFLPLMFLYFAIYENEGFFSIPEENVYRFLSIAYGVVSLVVIAFASRQSSVK